MRSLKWSISHAVFVTEIDDEHKEIFQALSDLQVALSSRAAYLEIEELTQRLIACIAEHFAHEERLMRAARYGSFRWHKRQHDNARRRVGQVVERIEQEETGAGIGLVEYLTSWLHDHTRLADRMMGAFLRNEQRCAKLIFRAGTKPLEACDWLDSKGDKFAPFLTKSDL